MTEAVQLPLPIGPVLLKTSKDEAVEKVTGEFDQSVEDLKEAVPNMVAFVMLAIGLDGKVKNAVSWDDRCPVSVYLFPELARNAVIVRLAED